MMNIRSVVAYIDQWKHSMNHVEVKKSVAFTSQLVTSTFVSNSAAENDCTCCHKVAMSVGLWYIVIHSKKIYQSLVLLTVSELEGEITMLLLCC